MVRGTSLLLAGILWAAGGAALAETDPPPKPQPAKPAQPAAQPQSAPTGTPKQVPVHPIRTQTTFVVDPTQIQGAGALGEKVGPITVTLNYFDKLPGIDLEELSPQRRQRVLERANKEPCTCGCKGDTVARCLVNDPACKLVKTLAQQIYEEERLRPESSGK